MNYVHRQVGDLLFFPRPQPPPPDLLVAPIQRCRLQDLVPNYCPACYGNPGVCFSINLFGVLGQSYPFSSVRWIVVELSHVAESWCCHSRLLPLIAIGGNIPLEHHVHRKAAESTFSTHRMESLPLGEELESSEKKSGGRRGRIGTALIKDVNRQQWQFFSWI